MVSGGVFWAPAMVDRARTTIVANIVKVLNIARLPRYIVTVKIYHIVKQKSRRVLSNPCPMQDEPEGELSFQHKMSLKRRGMLRIDTQRAPSREAELESDRGVSKSQRRDPIRRRNPEAGLSLDPAGSVPVAVTLRKAAR